LNFLLVHTIEVERLMCEVEFWEVFLRKEQWFLKVVTINPPVDCRVAELVWVSNC